MRISSTLDENPRPMAMCKTGNSIAASKGSRTGRALPRNTMQPDYAHQLNNDA